MKSDIELKIEIPQGVTVALNEGGLIIVKGPKGENKRVIRDAKVKFEIKDNKVMLRVAKASKKEKSVINTYCKHIQNMIKGVIEGYVYKLKICSGHFPMNVSVSGNKLIVKNFLGEKYPRTLDLKEGAKVNVEGNIISVEGIDREICGQTAGDIENLMRITSRDRRIFQDGIYIIEKAGKSL